VFTPVGSDKFTRFSGLIEAEGLKHDMLVPADPSDFGTAHVNEDEVAIVWVGLVGKL
jgi:hypothetical protein